MSSEQLSLRQGVEWREVEGEIVALDLERSVYLAANSSGALIWRLLSKGATRTQLVEEVARSYGIDTAVAERDVDAFLGELETNGCLSRRAPE